MTSVSEIPDDAQICPNGDCCHWLEVSDEDWYICPNCGELFYARPSEGDIEDWHFLPYALQGPISPLEDIVIATDHGPSRWTVARGT